MFADFQRALGVAGLIDEHAAEAKTGCAALLETELDQPTSALKNLGRKLPAVFAGHRAFDALDDVRGRTAVVLELLGAVVDGDAGTLADVFIVAAFVGVLKTTPAAVKSRMQERCLPVRRVQYIEPAEGTTPGSRS